MGIEVNKNNSLNSDNQNATESNNLGDDNLSIETISLGDGSISESSHELSGAIDSKDSGEQTILETADVETETIDLGSSSIERGGGGGSCGCVVYDGLDSNSQTDALSANQGRILNDKILALEEANNPTSLNVSISPTALQKKGTTTNVTITVSASKKDGTSVQVSDILINGISKTSPAAYEGVVSTTTYSISALANGKRLTASKSITFASPIFIGFSSGETVSAVSTSELSEQTLRASLGTLNWSGSNDNVLKYLWILSPFRVNKVTSDGFSADMNTSVETIINGTTYYCYRSTSKSALGLFNIQIS